MLFSAFWLLGAALAGLALLVLKGGRDKPVNRSFALFTLGLAGWVLGIGGLAEGGLPQTWGRFTFASASIVPAAFLSFAWAYPTPGRWPPWGVRGTAWGLGGLLALTSLTTRLVIQADSRLATPFHRTSGPLYPAFAAYFLAASVVVPLVGGLSLDAKLHTGPLFFFLGLLVGIVAAVSVVYTRFVRRYL